MSKQERHAFLESLSDFTLYETFYEQGTMLGGTLVALERDALSRKDTGKFHRYRKERFAMGDDRDRTEKADRIQQIRLIEQWEGRRERLEHELEHR